MTLAYKLSPLMVPIDMVMFSNMRKVTRSKPVSKKMGMSTITIRFEHLLHFVVPKTLLKFVLHLPQRTPVLLKAHSSSVSSI